MNRLLTLATLAVALGSTTLVAQTVLPHTAAVAPQHHRHNPHKAAMRISHKLGLSADQTARLEPILADRQQKVQALRANTSISEEQRKQQMHAIQKDTRMQMSSVLTPDQMKQMKELRHERKHAAAATPTGV